VAVSLAVEGAVVAFGGLRALDGITAEFAPGAITGLIGPNGSGKSTLVNMIAGQLTPVAGRIHLGEQEITRMRADKIARRGLARTYQIPRVPPQLTVQEVIGVPLTYIGATDRRLSELSDALSIAQFCGLSHPIDCPCAQLPVPDLRRLEIARALACAPSVLLLDEVMAGLSHADASQVVRLIRRIHAADITIVIIEHVMRIIAELCASVLVLNNGSVLASGHPREVLTDPAVREAYLGKGLAL
jgi:branched-chain amino acid transport system ATP-binding protein